LSQKLRRLAFLPLGALICYYCFLNTQFGHYLVRNAHRVSPYYDPDPRNGIIVREFFSKLADAEQARGSRREIQLTAEKTNDWPITIGAAGSELPMNFHVSHRA